jgi:hypothetical protein
VYLLFEEFVLVLEAIALESEGFDGLPRLVVEPLILFAVLGFFLEAGHELNELLFFLGRQVVEDLDSFGSRHLN